VSKPCSLGLKLVMVTKMQRRKRKPSLLRRLLNEIENFATYFETEVRGQKVEKGVLAEIVQLGKPPRRRLHPQVLALLRELLGEGTDEDEKAKKKVGKSIEGKPLSAWRESKMAKCAICGVEAEDVFEVSLSPIKKVGDVGEMLKAKELEGTLVLDVPVTKLCAYCADLHGIKHPNPEIAKKVAYYTDLMKRAVPSLPESVEKPEGAPKIDEDKVEPVLVEQVKEFISMARKMERLLGEWREEEVEEEEEE